MATKFALHELKMKMPDGSEFSFWFDGNGKITLDNGSFHNPAPNAFSLVQVKDCPSATPTCTSVCYVHKLEKAEAEVHSKYSHNSKTIREILENSIYHQITERAFAEWIKENCPHGFRWHVSGDIFSLEYARFIASVCNFAPHIFFWIYTRSFDFVDPLMHAPNLVVNLSADKDNYAKALLTHEKFETRICYLSLEGELPKDLPAGSVIFPNYTLRGRELSDPTEAPWWQSLSQEQKRMVCPPDFFGQSEKFRCGPCRKCLTH